MKLVDKLPAVFTRFNDFGGVLDFAVFDDASGTEHDVLTAIPAALRHRKSLDIAKLKSLGYRRLLPPAFFGDWCDPASGVLVKRGQFKTRDGRELVNPTLDRYERAGVVSGGGGIPEAGSGGQFAYAFFNTPYGLTAKSEVVQQAFEGIKAFILPPDHAAEIWDWSSPLLPEVSDYFDAGMEWWGVFLFSVYVPGKRRLTIIAGSTTD